MSERCAYCKKFSTLATRISHDRVVCPRCASKGQDILVHIIGLVTAPVPPKRTPPRAAPGGRRRLLQQAEQEKQQREKEENKKMNKFNPFTLAAIVAISMFAGATVRCDVDDDKDKDKDKQAEFVDIHGHDIQEAVADAMPGALVDFGDPDYQCIAVGSIDRQHDTDFDVLFITGCHNLD